MFFRCELSYDPRFHHSAQIFCAGGAVQNGQPPELPRAMVVLNVVGEELRWADGVSCERSNGILQPKVGIWEDLDGFGEWNMVKHGYFKLRFFFFNFWKLRSVTTPVPLGGGKLVLRPLIWRVKLKCFAS